MSQEKPTQTEIGIAGVVRNQGASELNSSRRHEHIDNRIGRTGWNIMCVVIAAAILTGCFMYNHINKLEKKIEENVALSGDNQKLSAQVAALETENASLKKNLNSKNDQILALYAAADQESEVNAKYYTHMEERAEGYIDHIMSLNLQLDAKEAEAKRYKGQRDTKKKFMSLAFAVTADNPLELMDAAENIGEPEDLVTMKFYPLAVELAVGLGSVNILEHLITLPNWDKTITKRLASKVLDPATVPLQKFKDLTAKYNQQAGRFNDMVKNNAKKDGFIEELKGQIYDTKYMPYSLERVMIIEAYHTVAENVRPLNLKKYVGVATTEQWIAYLKMAVARNSNNVYEAIMELDEVTSLPDVKAYINATEVLALSTVAKKHQKNIGAIRDHQKEIDDQINDYAESVKQQLNGQ